MKENVPISPAMLIAMNKKLLGSFAGSARPHLDLPHFLDLYRSGRLPVDKLVSRRYALEDSAPSFCRYGKRQGGAWRDFVRLALLQTQ